MKNIWKPIEDALNEPENYNQHIYYVGGTLCVDLPNKGFVAMNLDGKGFTAGSNLTKNTKIFIPLHIQELVRKTYLKTKGFTTHFSKEICSTN